MQPTRSADAVVRLPKIADHDDGKVGEADRIQHRGHDRSKPYDPADGKGGFDGQRLFGKRVGAAGLGEFRGHFRKTECGQQCNHTVQSKRQHRSGARRCKRSPRECQDASAHDRANPDSGGADEPDVA